MSRFYSVGLIICWKDYADIPRIKKCIVLLINSILILATNASYPVVSGGFILVGCDLLK